MIEAADFDLARYCGNEKSKVGLGLVQPWGGESLGEWCDILHGPHTVVLSATIPAALCAALSLEYFEPRYIAPCLDSNSPFPL